MVDTTIGLYALKVATVNGTWALMAYPAGTSAEQVVKNMNYYTDERGIACRFVKQGEGGTGGWQEVVVTGGHLTFGQYHETDDNCTTCRCYSAGYDSFEHYGMLATNYAHPDEFMDGFTSAYETHHDI